MKNKWDHEVVNSQEDEDGFNLNPGSVFNYESTREKQDINSNRGSSNNGHGSTNLTVILPVTRQRISELIFSSSTVLQSQKNPESKNPY